VVPVFFIEVVFSRLFPIVSDDSLGDAFLQYSIAESLESDETEVFM
jgi:hypothetical protein